MLKNTQIPPLWLASDSQIITLPALIKNLLNGWYVWNPLLWEKSAMNDMSSTQYSYKKAESNRHWCVEIHTEIDMNSSHIRKVAWTMR